ncbi:hypothetical protein ACQ4M3_07525 [Leptolyngbya sp. AN03gr2]|uniref:hypothetical protein n=1 Tax=unclassified Leptolyngbya TaxID=2650499 RepID=UPI003D322420
MALNTCGSQYQSTSGELQANATVLLPTSPKPAVKVSPTKTPTQSNSFSEKNEAPFDPTAPSLSRFFEADEVLDSMIDLQSLD